MTNEKKIMPVIYFFRKFNVYPIPGYDQISIISFNKEQAYNTLKELVKDPEQFYLDHTDLFLFEAD